MKPLCSTIISVWEVLGASLGTQQEPSSCGILTDPSVNVPGIGTIHGTTLTPNPGVRQFLGIPYAQPPIGARRFAPPQPATVPFPNSLKTTTQLPPSCMQHLRKQPPSIYTQEINEFNLQGLNTTSPRITEDCLTLSIWTPSELSPTHLLPVIIFIHGGAFSIGGQDVPYQVPAQWVQRTQSHIVVSFNYRLNIFGFPSAAGLPEAEQNLGLLDQRLAVQWVHDHIFAFGGDPSRITLWGQSAGALSVGYYQFAYATDPLVTGLIMDSGNEMLDITVSSDSRRGNFTAVASQFGCGNLSAAEELACMRNVSAQDMEDFVSTYTQAGSRLAVPFLPVVDNRTVFDNYTALALSGNLAKVPVILGSNAQDGVPFVPYSPGGVNTTLADIATLKIMFCPAFKAATNRLKAGLQVFRYGYLGNFSNISPEPWMGAYHSSELPLIFGTHPDFRGNSTALEYATSQAMQDSWLSFASAPSSCKATGMAKQNWPAYASVANGQVREFGVGSTGALTGSTKAIEALCPSIFQP